MGSGRCIVDVRIGHKGSTGATVFGGSLQLQPLHDGETISGEKSRAVIRESMDHNFKMDLQLKTTVITLLWMAGGILLVQGGPAFNFRMDFLLRTSVTTLLWTCGDILVQGASF